MKPLIFCFYLLVCSMLSMSAAWADSAAPHAFVSKVTQDTLSALRDNQERIKADPSVLEKIINDYILPNMDFTAMSKIVLTPSNWKKSSSQQREQFSQEFKRLLVRTYTKSLREYSSEEIEFLPFEPGKKPNKLALVKSQIKRSASANIPINYRLRYKEEDGWKVFDIIIEGVSLIKNYRASFGQEIHQNGVDHLIESLKQKNNQADSKASISDA